MPTFLRSRPAGEQMPIATLDMRPPSTSWRDWRCCGSVRSWSRGSTWAWEISATSRLRSARPANASDTGWPRGVVARTDPNEQESVELLPHLDSGGLQLGVMNQAAAAAHRSSNRRSASMEPSYPVSSRLTAP